jgi:hypothetical protein
MEDKKPEKKPDKKSHRRVSIGSKYIRPIPLQNKRRGFYSDTDFIELDLPPEKFSPLSPHKSPPSPPPLSEAVKLQIEARARERDRERTTYTPYVCIYNGASFIYNQSVTTMFQSYLLSSDIICNNSTRIVVLINKIIGMFKEEYQKDVVYCNLIRDNIIFHDQAVLGDYSTQIQEWGNSTGLQNYFYINVVLQDLPTENTIPSVSTDIKSAGSTPLRILNAQRLPTFALINRQLVGGLNMQMSKKRKTNKRRRTRKQRKTRK